MFSAVFGERRRRWKDRKTSFSAFCNRNFFLSIFSHPFDLRIMCLVCIQEREVHPAETIPELFVLKTLHGNHENSGVGYLSLFSQRPNRKEMPTIPIITITVKDIFVSKLKSLSTKVPGTPFLILPILFILITFSMFMG